MLISWRKFIDDQRGVIDPATAAAAVKSTMDIAAFFSKLFGFLPRGDFQKFSRTVYPYMVAQADQTGKNVYAFWFGDVIRVAPGGGWGSIGIFGSLAAAQEKYKELAEKEGVLFEFSCGPGLDANNPADIQAKCTFIRYTGSLFGRVITTILEPITPGEPTRPAADLKDVPLAQPPTTIFGAPTQAPVVTAGVVSGVPSGVTAAVVVGATIILLFVIGRAGK